MRLFSEFVAADAEANEPVIKEEKPKERPLTFKYYTNEGESMTEEATDDILGAASEAINKKKVVMKYDNSDPDYGISPL